MTLLGTRSLEAQDSAPLTSDIPAEPLGPALATFARQTGLHVVYVSKIVRDQHSHAVTAGLTATEALARFAGHGTQVRVPDSGARAYACSWILWQGLQAPLAPVEMPPPLSGDHGHRVAHYRALECTAANPILIVTAEDIELPGHTDRACRSAPRRCRRSP